MSQRVCLTGGSGFVGSAVVEELVARGYAVNALVNRKPIDNPAVRSIPGGLFNPRAVDEALSDCDAAIHLVGIIIEQPANGITFTRIHVGGTQAIVDGCQRRGVRRIVHMSALGTRPDAASQYHRTKARAEEIVRASSLEWTIFRPSLIHGPRGEFMQMEAKWARKAAPPFLFMPYFGAGLFGCGGAGKLQPVFVGDVARAMVDALEKPATIGEVYPIGGPDEMTWPEMHQMIAKEIVGHPRWVMAIPVWKARLLTHIVPAGLLPFNRDQVEMSRQDNTCGLAKLKDDFGWLPRAFQPLLHDYASQM